MIVMPDTTNQNDIRWDQCMGSLRILESSHMISLLIYLREVGPSTKMDIYHSVARGPNMSEKLSILESKGIIQMEKKGRTTVYLTDKGEKVADHLRAVMDLILRTEG